MNVWFGIGSDINDMGVTPSQHDVRAVRLAQQQARQVTPQGGLTNARGGPNGPPRNGGVKNRDPMGRPG